MFFIIDVIQDMKLLKRLQGSCRECGQEGELELIKTCQCLRLFFIPIFKWNRKYFMKHSCGAIMSLNEEDAIALLHVGMHPDQIQMEVVGRDNRCQFCGRMLEDEFICCPYCGRKRADT